MSKIFTKKFKRKFRPAKDLEDSKESLWNITPKTNIRTKNVSKLQTDKSKKD